MKKIEKKNITQWGWIALLVIFITLLVVVGYKLTTTNGAATAPAVAVQEVPATANKTCTISARVLKKVEFVTVVTNNPTAEQIAQASTGNFQGWTAWVNCDGEKVQGGRFAPAAAVAAGTARRNQQLLLAIANSQQNLSHDVKQLHTDLNKFRSEILKKISGLNKKISRAALDIKKIEGQLAALEKKCKNNSLRKLRRTKKYKALESKLKSKKTLKRQLKRQKKQHVKIAAKRGVIVSEYVYSETTTVSVDPYCVGKQGRLNKHTYPHTWNKRCNGNKFQWGTGDGGLNGGGFGGHDNSDNDAESSGDDHDGSDNDAGSSG